MGTQCAAAMTAAAKQCTAFRAVRCGILPTQDGDGAADVRIDPNNNRLLSRLQKLGKREGTSLKRLKEQVCELCTSRDRKFDNFRGL